MARAGEGVAVVRRDRLPYALAALTVLAAAEVLLIMGRVPICTCGHIKLWHGVTMSSENSQHLTDWYTPSHLLHGLIFYAALSPLAARLAFGWRLFIATIVECAWEIAENTNAVIERYREVTISLDYYGDSVINSVFDIFTMIAGFWLARRIPVPASVVILLGFELLTAYVIRDGLALNVLMLIYPLDTVRVWQGGL
jgi:hypothetical protein